ncbi:MAG: hypothetical protein PVI90_00220 [Desulfobacteraceae bacterium]|jgi:hypothetical protein
MGIVQIIIDDSTDKTITGQFTFDRDNGGVLLLPGGTTFPTSPVAGEYFVRTDELKLYRRNDGNTAWETIGALSAHALGGSSHTADTLANLNTKISDGNLDFDTASRPPTSHTHGGGDITSAVANAVDADTVDGEHASAFANASHTHTESDITDLDHDAQKIKGVTIDDTDIANGKILKYNSTSGNLEYEDDATGGGSNTLIMQDEGSPIPNTPHTTLNVTGGGASISDAGSGVATLNVPSAAPPPEDKPIDFADFINNVDWGWDNSVNGTGYYTILTLLGGQLELASGATAYGGASVAQNYRTLTKAGNCEFKGRIRLVEATDIYVELGLLGTSGHYALFSTSSAGYWRTRTQAGGSETVTNDVLTKDTDWYIFEIICSSSQIVFKIDDSTVATHTTNLPTNSMKAHVYMQSSSAGDKRCRIDYIRTTSDRET